MEDDEALLLLILIYWIIGSCFWVVMSVKLSSLALLAMSIGLFIFPVSLLQAGIGWYYLFNGAPEWLLRMVM